MVGFLRRRWLVVFIVALWALAGTAAVAFVARPDTHTYRVPSESMIPTINVGDHVRVNKEAYADQAPQIGDIVIFHPPRGAEESQCSKQPPAGQMCAGPGGGRSSVQFIKRVVGLPGDHLAMRNGLVVRNGKPLREPYVADCGGGEGCDFPREIVIAKGQYFMLGDNRGASDDSRFWGAVPKEWIVGRVDRCSTLGWRCSPRR
jgi:signal peptidase I